MGEAIASTSGEIGQILEASEMLPHFSSQSKAAVRRSNSPDRFYKNLTFTRQNVKTDTEKILYNCRWAERLSSKNEKATR